MALRHYVGHPNIGDVVNPRLVRYVTGCRTYFEWNIRNPHLLALGSIIDWATDTSHVWGSGLIDPDRGCGGLRADRVWALRGKESHAALRRQGVAVGDVPLGDPGALAALAFNLDPAGVERRWRLGIVPHYVDFQHPAIHALARLPDTCILDVRADPAALFRQMMACETIASSSLHGLIFAETLGIPNLWLQLPGSALSPFKFNDWFSTTRRPQFDAFCPGGSESLWDIAGRCEIHELDLDLDALAGALPDAVIDELTDRGRRYLAVPDDPVDDRVVVLIVAHHPEQLRSVLFGLAGQTCPWEAIVVIPDRVGPYFRQVIADDLKDHGLMGWPLGGEGLSVRDAAIDSFIKKHQDFRSSPRKVAVVIDDAPWLALIPDALAIACDLLDNDAEIEAVAAPQDVATIARARLQRAAGAVALVATRCGSVEIVPTDFAYGFQLRRPGTFSWQCNSMVALVQPEDLWEGGLLPIEERVAAAGRV